MPPAGAAAASGVKAGWDELEKAELAKALRQPLLLQTPLQVLLETLFTRIQAQAQLFNDLQKRIDRIEARDFVGEELVSRIRMCEESLGSLKHDRLSPFNQQDFMDRLDAVESQLRSSAALVAASTVSQPPPAPAPPSPRAGAATTNAAASRGADESKRPSADGVTSSVGTSPRAPLVGPLEERIGQLEGRLAGVYNLGGKLLALEQIAAHLGAEIPDLAGGDADSTDTGTDRGPADASAASRASATASFAQGPRTARSSASLASKRGQHPSILGRLPSAMLSADKAAELQAAVQELQAGGGELRSQVESLQEEVGTLRMTAAMTEETLSLRVATLEAASVEMRENLMGEINGVRASIRASTAGGGGGGGGGGGVSSVSSEPALSYADLSALNARVEALATGVTTANASIVELRDTGLKPLSESVSDLKDQMKRATEARDMDTLFHSRITKLEGAIGDVRNEIHLTVQHAMEDVAKLADLGPIEEALTTCAAVADVQVLAAQQTALAASVSGMADWLAMRPDTADGAKGTGASATRFKCLTCDREIRSQGAGSSTDHRQRGTFLPKLDSMPPAAGGFATQPLGPGLNAGELRRLAEERGGRGSTAPADAQRRADAEATAMYGTDQLGRGKGRSSPAHARGGRVSVSLAGSNGGALSSLMSKITPGAPRTPVFI